jgi:signal transduction histidine kinase
VFSAELLTQALSGKTVIGYATLDGVHLRVAAVPILDGGQVDGAVETARELTDFDALDRSQMLTLLVLVPLALLVGGLGALFLTNKALKPVAEATAAAEKISETELSTRLQVQGKDELAQLSSTFNGMLDRLQASFEKQRQAFADLARAYENQRRFTADASHELRTPLTRLKLATGSALSEAGLPPFVIEPLHIADQSADSMSKIVNQLLLLSKADAGQLGLVLAPLDLRIVVAEASDTMPKRTPPLEVSLPDNPVTVNGDEDHLRRVVLNLLQNAYRHTPEGKPILLIVRAEGPNAVLRVSDQGVGVSDEHLEHLGKRFYRVDDSRTGSEQGVGLGLSICKSIIESLGGTLSFESGQGEGLSVTVRIPLKA